MDRLYCPSFAVPMSFLSCVCVRGWGGYSLIDKVGGGGRHFIVRETPMHPSFMCLKLLCAQLYCFLLLCLSQWFKWFILAFCLPFSTVIFSYLHLHCLGCYLPVLSFFWGGTILDVLYIYMLWLLCVYTVIFFFLLDITNMDWLAWVLNACLFLFLFCIGWDYFCVLSPLWSVLCILWYTGWNMLESDTA